MDARKLAIRMNKNPNTWVSIKQILPLLEKSAYYKKTRHGFARGREAVHYVDSIRRYYETLVALSIKSIISPAILAQAAQDDSELVPLGNYNYQINKTTSETILNIVDPE